MPNDTVLLSEFYAKPPPGEMKMHAFWITFGQIDVVDNFAKVAVQVGLGCLVKCQSALPDSAKLAFVQGESEARCRVKVQMFGDRVRQEVQPQNQGQRRLV